MDWGKAKIYLIIAFVITNMILIISIFSDMSNNASYFTKESYQSLNEFLLQKNLSLHTELPKETPKMGTVKVEFESFNLKGVKEKFSDFAHDIEIIGEKKLVVMGKRKLAVFDKEYAASDAQIFIKTYDINENLAYKNVYSDEENIVVVYNSLYNKRFLEESYVKFTYLKDGNLKLEILKMNPVEESNSKKNVMTSVEAVMRASRNMQENETITQVVLGYNYTQSENLTIANTKTATAFPCWRIKTKDNKYYYIEALEF